jgi:hypothetical protein
MVLVLLVLVVLVAEVVGVGGSIASGSCWYW